jgi:fucose permease
VTLLDKPRRAGRVRATVFLSYAAFMFVGVTSGTGGVLLVAQMSDYGVDRATIGITFFTGSAGFVLAGLSSGALIARFGIRVALMTGGAAYALAGLCLAARPPFALFVAVQLATGYGLGILESVLNTHLAALPGATMLLNRLHAFWGVGSLIGPVLAAWITGFASWRIVLLILAAASVPLIASFMAFPGPAPRGRAPDPLPASVPEAAGAEAGEAVAASGSRGSPRSPRSPGRNLLSAALRDPGVLGGAVMLAVYVGLEIGVGSWAYSYLVQGRGLGGTIAGYAVSGYWLGLTAGRFLISPLAARAGLTTSRMMYACLTGITAAATLAWLAPDAAAASAALVVLGFFLGPVFPTTMAITPRLTTPELVPTAIGVMNAGSVIGGSALPWLAGVITQDTGIWTLLPFALALALLQFAAWRPLAARIRSAPEPLNR